MQSLQYVATDVNIIIEVDSPNYAPRDVVGWRGQLALQVAVTERGSAGQCTQTP